MNFQEIKNTGLYKAVQNYDRWLTTFIFLENIISDETEMQIHQAVSSIESFICGEINDEFR